jgi:hypothetical protein
MRRRWAIDPRRGGAAQSIKRASGSMGAGEGRSEVGCWPGGITNPVKIFSKIRNPVGSIDTVKIP